MDAAQRFANGAAFRLIAGAMLGEAMRQNHGAVDGADYFESADSIGVACQFVAAVGTRHRPEDSRAGELLEDLGEQRHGQMVGFGHVLGAGRCARDRGKVTEGDQPVVRFFGQLEHRTNEDLSCP